MRITLMTAVSAIALLAGSLAPAAATEAAMEKSMDAAAAETSASISLASYLDADIKNAAGTDLGDVDDVQITDDWTIAAVVISDDTVLDPADKSATVSPDELTVTGGKNGEASVTVATTISDLIPQGDAEGEKEGAMAAGVHSARDSLLEQAVFDASGETIATVHDAIVTAGGTLDALILSNVTEADPLGRLVAVDPARFAFVGEAPGVSTDFTEAELGAMATFTYESGL